MSNWRQALEAGKLDTLRRLIDAVERHRAETGVRITPVQLRLVLEHRGFADALEP